MELIFEFLFSFLGEILIQLFGELLIELGIHVVAEAGENPRLQNPWLAGLGYILLGLLVGLISLKVMRQGLFHSHALRFINLLVTPLIAGLMMALIGRWRRRREQPTIRLESFLYGYLFAFSMGIIRYCFAN